MYKYINKIKQNKNYIIKSLVIVLLLMSICLTGFTEFSDDNLYSYQWGLKNNGNFLISREILAENYNIAYFDKKANDYIFFDDKNLVDFTKTNNFDYNMAYALFGCDISFELGYIFYKQIGAKRDCVVAIIDSGIDINHPELIDNIWVNKDETINGLDDDGNGYIDDVNGYNFYDGTNNIYMDRTIDIHGTHAAGTIVAKHGNGGTKGIAYDSHIKIMPLKILGEGGKGTMSGLIEAINYAKNNGANICNISLGTYQYDSELDNVIRNNPDMLFVVAAGNGANFIGYSLDERDVYPAKFNYDNVITVSNILFDGSRYASANYGSYVDIFAPGTLILSTVPENNYGYLTGTSMAAPFVTASSALIYSAFPNIPLSMIKSIIIKSATPIQELLGLCRANGMLNIYNALVLASQQ